MGKGKLKKQEFTLTNQKAALLQAADSIGKKIQYQCHCPGFLPNKRQDVGKAILESYSRVLKSLAFNIVASIEDLLYGDGINKQTEKLSSMSVISSHKKLSMPFSVPVGHFLPGSVQHG